MKKLIILVALCLSVYGKAMAQAGSIVINNNTGCDVYFILMGDVSPGCGLMYHSSIITLAAAASLTISDPFSVPGGMNCATCSPSSLAMTDYFIGIRVYDRLPSMCGAPGAINLSEGCAGQGFGPTPYTGLDNSCSTCATINVDWVPASPPGTGATVNFN